MSEATRQRSRISFQAIANLAQLADYTIPFAIRAICKLGVADHLAAGPRSIEELATECGAHAPSLLRAMRALVSRGIFAELQPGQFELTPMADLLRNDHPLSMRYAFRLAPDADALAAFEYTVRTGEPSFEHLFGQDYFSYLSARPELLAEFHASQRALTRIEEIVVFRSYNWAALQTVVDIGGGDGTFLAHLLAANSGLRGILFDLPNTVAEAPQILAGAKVADRCQIVGGSFFETPIPPGADAYLIKRVLVGLDDRQVTTVLRSIRTAMRPDSRLLIFEPMMSEGDVSTAMDLLMLVLGGGQVRTPAEFEMLLAAADLQLIRVVTTRMFPFIEAGP